MMSRLRSHIEVLSPKGRPSHEANRDPYDPVVRPGSLEGKSIAVVANWKPISLPFLTSLLEQVKKKISVGTSYVGAPDWKFTHPDGVRASTLEVDSISEYADLMLSGVADWGGCTVWSCQASIEFAQRGLPSVVIATDVFGSLAMQYLSTRGYGSIPVIVTANPIVYLEGQDLEERAASLAEEVVARLTDSRPQTRE